MSFGNPARLQLVTLPNYITFSRIVAVPLFMWLVLTPRLSSATGEKEAFASLLFIAASITDGIDGYLARRRGQITTLGMLLDPLADKLLITAALVTLVQFNPAMVPAWIAVLVIGREFLVSGLRSIASSEGFTLEASDLGKYKMFVQIVSVVEDTQRRPASIEPAMFSKNGKGATIHLRDYPRRAVGEMVVLNVTPTSSTAMVIFALEDLRLGDFAEME